jgi:K+-transporting ATPase ATPase B chain
MTRNAKVSVAEHGNESTSLTTGSEVTHKHNHTRQFSLFDLKLVKQAVVDSFKKLSPQQQWKNPVMFVVYMGSMITTALWLQASFGQGEAPAQYILSITLWLWFTVLFANFAEAMAEGRSKAQAASLKSAKRDITAKLLEEPKRKSRFLAIAASQLKVGNVVLVEAGDFIPGDGEVIEGVASVDESAITGESAPVIRESGGDFSSVTGGTRILSDWLIVRITANPGESHFLIV